MLLAKIAVIFALVGTGWLWRAPTDAPDDVQVLIHRLIDTDPTVRKQSADKLVAMGPRARPAVLNCMRERDPQLAPRAAEVLLRLPWAKSDDPPVVRQLLAAYGQRDEDGRAQIVAQLATHAEAAPTLVRLMHEDPSKVVQWRIFAILPNVPSESLSKTLREMDVSADAAPAVAASARAWMLVNNEKAIELFRRAVDLEAEEPNDDGESKQRSDLAQLEGVYLTHEFDFAFDLLAGEALLRGHPEEAADVRRDQIARLRQLEADDTAAVGALFSLHARYGPLPGFESDLRENESSLGTPELLFTLGKMYEHAGMSLLAEATYRGAVGFNSAFYDRALATAANLEEARWPDLALRMQRVCLRSAVLLDAQVRPRVEYRARYMIARLLADQDQDAVSARLTQEALDDLIKTDANVLPAQDEVTTLIEWRKFRAARAAGDQKVQREQLDKLASRNSSDADTMIDIVTELKRLGRVDDAGKAFVRAYGSHKERVGEDPMDPESLNNLAWLCARCDERLDEAAALSLKAIRLAPGNSAYLDTAAEAQFRTGHASEAARLEKLALMLKPGDPFMTGQLKRFEGGKP